MIQHQWLSPPSALKHPTVWHNSFSRFLFIKKIFIFYCCWWQQKHWARESDILLLCPTTAKKPLINLRPFFLYIWKLPHRNPKHTHIVRSPSWLQGVTHIPSDGHSFSSSELLQTATLYTPIHKMSLLSAFFNFINAAAIYQNHTGKVGSISDILQCQKYIFQLFSLFDVM